MKYMLVLFLVAVGGCTAGPRNDTYPFLFASKGEVKFFNRCMTENKNGCRRVRVELYSDESYKVIDSYALPANRRMGGVVSSFRCDDLKSFDAKSVASNEGVIREISLRRSKDINGEICSFDFPTFDDATSGGFNFVRIERREKRHESPVSVNLTYTFSGGMTVFISAIAAPNYPLYLEGNFFETPERSGIKEIPKGDASFTEFQAPILDEYYIGISSSSNWAPLAAPYREKSNTDVSVKGSGSLSELRAALREFSNLNLKYAITNDNFGIVPRLTYETIINNGQGDCKDLTVVMMHLLAEEGIRSHPVVLGSDFGLPVAPQLRRLPDLRWADHVILFLPDFNAYVDATLQHDKLLIDGDYEFSGAVGVNLDVGEMVIVGRK